MDFFVIFRKARIMELNKIKEKLLFNVNGDDTVRSVIKGNPTNTFDLYNIKYKWAYKCWDNMLANHWIPEKSGMTNDKNSYNQLSDREKEAFLKILSFLIFLDSIQTNNVPNIADYITAPEIILALSRQQFDEALHSRSYSYILTSIFDKMTAEKAIYYWRDDPVLAKRNSLIANIYQEFKDNPTEEGLVMTMIANYILEGIYFYNGFYFFYNLGSRGLMTDTVTQIRYINRDELQHCLLFRNILLALKEEESKLMEKMEDKIYDMFKMAVEQEISFSNHIIGEDILGINKDSIHEYTHYIANKRLKAIKMKDIFEKCKNPYKHLDMLAGVEDETSMKANMFEVQSIAYKQANVLDGWDDL